MLEKCLATSVALCFCGKPRTPKQHLIWLRRFLPGAEARRPTRVAGGGFCLASARVKSVSWRILRPTAITRL